MGSMDRNTVIGFVLLAGLLFVYLYLSTQNSKELAYAQQKEKDSRRCCSVVKSSTDVLSLYFKL